MLVRLTFFNFLIGKLEEGKRIYHDHLVPVVRQQKGNLDCKLLEPIDSSEDFVSMTVWETREDADAYHASSLYRELIEKIQVLYSKNPVLKVYTTEKLMEPA
jgi:heme-degrading monooxygenase HmoA